MDFDSMIWWFDSTYPCQKIKNGFGGDKFWRKHKLFQMLKKRGFIMKKQIRQALVIFLSTLLVATIFIILMFNVIQHNRCYAENEVVIEDRPIVEEFSQIEVNDEVDETDEEVGTEVDTNELELPDRRIYRVTAYCGCSKCCGKWAKNRPDGIVYGAYGIPLKNGYSCASTLPKGTQVYIEGYGIVETHDTMAKWVINKFGKDCIDIYFDKHSDAYAFGREFIGGVIVGTSEY